MTGLSAINGRFGRSVSLAGVILLAIVIHPKESTMNLPLFLHAGAAPQTLEDDETLAYQPLLARWLIDLTVMLDWHRPFTGRRRSRELLWENTEFLNLTGLPEWPDDDVEEGDHRVRRQRRRSLEQQFSAALQQRRAELAATPLDPDQPLWRNLTLLGELLNLGPVEQAILAFAILLNTDRQFQRIITERCQPTTTTLLFRILAQLTGASVKAVQQALEAQNVLMITDLISLRSDTADLEDKIDVRRDLPHVLMTPHEDMEALIDCFLKRSPRRSLTLANFPHLQRDTAAVAGLLRAALHNKLSGVNVLLYGPPGVGKTEYAAVLAEAVNADLYEVNYADEDGDPIRGEARLRAFNLCQRLLARRANALLLFDEVEDVFERNPFADLFGGGRGRASGGKAWINRTLENNPAPALWITNDADSMDPAYLRRFDYSIRFATPPQSVRLTIARHHLGDWAGENDWLAQIAAHEHLTPAQLERAAKLARHAGDGAVETHRALVLQALDRSIGLLGYLNTDLPIPKLVAALKRRPQGVLCFYGPAGTGKSELARHIADELEKPLLVKRASDLLDMYVGQTEQRIAGMFNEARQREAVLVLDEADSFLRDRRTAHQSWEVTQVNELLTQVEAFEGIFIATTNLMETLDAASLRRFPWKVRFHWLKPAQRWALFAQELLRLGGSLAEAEALKGDLWGLERLTPGDVAVVVRQYELWGETPTAQAFYDRLCLEVAAKREDTAMEPPVAAPRRRTSAALYS
jgi:AAA+ superfamily predicted ATPase